MDDVFGNTDGGGKLVRILLSVMGYYGTHNSTSGQPGVTCGLQFLHLPQERVYVQENFWNNSRKEASRPDETIKLRSKKISVAFGHFAIFEDATDSYWRRIIGSCQNTPEGHQTFGWPMNVLLVCGMSIKQLILLRSLLLKLW
jgi:hypothetical protein